MTESKLPENNLMKLEDMNINPLTETNPTLFNVSILLLRITVGGILFVAGAGKVLGWFGGMGMDATVNIFITNMGIHPILAYLSCYTEFIGGFLLIVGLLTRPAAFAITINMLVAAVVTLPNGFMAGASYPFSMMVSSLVILLTGPMAYSLDARLVSGRAKDSDG